MQTLPFPKMPLPPNCCRCMEELQSTNWRRCQRQYRKRIRRQNWCKWWNTWWWKYIGRRRKCEFPQCQWCRRFSCAWRANDSTLETTWIAASAETSERFATRWMQLLPLPPPPSKWIKNVPNFGISNTRSKNSLETLQNKTSLNFFMILMKWLNWSAALTTNHLSCWDCAGHWTALLDFYCRQMNHWRMPIWKLLYWVNFPINYLPPTWRNYCVIANGSRMKRRCISSCCICSN